MYIENRISFIIQLIILDDYYKGLTDALLINYAIKIKTFKNLFLKLNIFTVLIIFVLKSFTISHHLKYRFVNKKK